MTYTFDQLRNTEILLNQAINSFYYPAVFRANFNAFLASARSVTFIMKHEFENENGFMDWYKEKQEMMRQNKNFKMFVDLRNESLKERPLGNQIKFTTQVNSTFQAGQEATIPAFRLDEIGSIVIDNNKPVLINGKPSGIISTTRYSYFFDQRPDDDAIELSKSYYNDLADIVEECHDKFSTELKFPYRKFF